MRLATASQRGAHFGGSYLNLPQRPLGVGLVVERIADLLDRHLMKERGYFGPERERRLSCTL